MFKLKNRHWWNIGQKYHRINYVIKVALGAADLRFELWHNGMKLSKDNPIKVEWHTAPAPEPQVLNSFNSLGEQLQPQIAVAKNWGSGEQWRPTENSGMIRRKHLPQLPIRVAQN